MGAKNVEAQAHRAINDDCLLGVFAHLSIQRDDEHLWLRLWCPTSKPICDLPRAMNCQERDFCRRRLARRKRLKDDISAQRPEIGDHLAREIAAKMAFVLADLNI